MSVKQRVLTIQTKLVMPGFCKVQKFSYMGKVFGLGGGSRVGTGGYLEKNEGGEEIFFGVFHAF